MTIRARVAGILMSSAHAGSGRMPQLTTLSHQEREPAAPQKSIGMDHETAVRYRVCNWGSNYSRKSAWNRTPVVQGNPHRRESKNLCMNIADGIWHNNVQNARPIPIHLFRAQHAQVRITRMTDEERQAIHRPGKIRYAPSARSKPTKYNPA